MLNCLSVSAIRFAIEIAFVYCDNQAWCFDQEGVPSGSRFHAEQSVYPDTAPGQQQR